LLDHQVGEQESTLPARKAPLVGDDPGGLGGDPTREEDLQLNLPCLFLAQLLPRFRRVFLRSPRVVEKVLHCECGFEARAGDEDVLVAEVQRHACEAHGMPLSRDEAVLLVFRAELAQGVLPAISLDPAAHTERKEAQ
jgi:Protein of unknown function (DUF1059)